MTDPSTLSAVEAARRIRDGRLTATALLRACLERIAAREPAVGAFAVLDTASALRQAERCDAGPPRGLLHGVPVGVKDIVDTADLVTAYGSARYVGHRPTRDAAVVTALRHAGAVIPGKTATTEFAGAQPAPTRHPRDPAVSPGGSSSGSVAAVADHMLPVAIGTQTAGSVIRPAAFCGIVGLKPSFGLLPLDGVRPVAESFDTIGTFGRTVADAALLLAALTGDARLAVDGAQAARPRIGVCRTPAWAAATPAVQEALDAAATTAGRQGAAVTDFALPALFDAAIADQIAVMGAETARGMHRDLAAGRQGLGPDTLAAADEGAKVTPAQEQAARARLDRCRAAFDADTGDWDVLICPSAADEAPAGLGWTGDPIFNRLWTALWVPCLTLPFTSGPRGLPIGLQVVARRGAEPTLLAAALWLERAIAERPTA